MKETPKKLGAVDAVLGAGIIIGYLDIVLMQLQQAEGLLGPALAMSLIVAFATLLALIVGVASRVSVLLDVKAAKWPTLQQGLCGIALSFPLWRLSLSLLRSPGMSLAVVTLLGAVVFGAGLWWSKRHESLTAAALGALTSSVLFYRAADSVGLIERVEPTKLGLELGLVFGGIVLSFGLASAIAFLLMADNWRARSLWLALGGVASGIILVILGRVILGGTYIAARQVTYIAGFIFVALGLYHLLSTRIARRHRAIIIIPSLVGGLWLTFKISPLDQAYIYVRNAPLAQEVLRETGLAKYATKRLLDELMVRGHADWGEPGESALPDSLVEKELSVLLITVDTLRYDHTGYSGVAADGLTPNMDRLAARSQRFHRAYAQGGLTTLSLSALFWSKYPRNIQFTPLLGSTERRFYLPGDIPEDATIFRIHQSPLSEPSQSLAELLLEEGFYTASVANDENLYFFAPGMGFTRGFDEVIYAPEAYKDLFGRMPAPEDLSDAFTVDLAKGVLEQIGDERFFMWVHLFSPHLPHRQHEGIDFGTYEGEIHYMDQQLGRLLEGLEEEGRLDDTLIILTADHGEELGEKGFRGHGVNLRETAMRVPLLIAIPGLDGADIEHEVGLVDVAPTVLNLLGLETPQAMEGYSLLGVMGGEGDWARPPVFIETWRYRGTSSYKDIDLSGAVVDGAKVVLDRRLNTIEYYEVSRSGREVGVTGLEPGADEWERFSRVAATLVEWAGEL